jgi:hypothetical protein
MVKSKANKEYAVEQLKAEGLEEVAEDIERGLYTDAQVGSVLANARQAKAAAEQGQAALERLLLRLICLVLRLVKLLQKVN